MHEFVNIRSFIHYTYMILNGKNYSTFVLLLLITHQVISKSFVNDMSSHLHDIIRIEYLTSHV